MEMLGGDLVTLGKRIEAARIAAGLNQTQLAKLIGVSRAAVSKWERDMAANITSDRFIRLANALGVNARWLMGIEPDPQPYQKVSLDEGALLALYRQLPGPGQEELSRFARYLADSLNPKPTVAAPYKPLKRAQ